MNARARLRENPFFVLGVPLHASRTEIERTAQRLLGELSLGREGARSYATPLGRVERTAEVVRRAAAELRDPAKRLVHEVWAALPVEVADAPEAAPGAGVSEATCAALLGLKAPRRP
jgi:hypothetical protein